MSLLKINNLSCCAVGCSMQHKTNLLSQVRLYSFPENPIRRRMWEWAVGGDNWKSTSESVLCQLHFVEGAPSENNKHPDYVPTVFQQSTDVEQKLSRYKSSPEKGQVENNSIIANDGVPFANETHPDYELTVFRQSTDVEQKLSRYEGSAEKRRVENYPIITNNAGRSLLKRSSATCCAVGCSMRRKTNLLSQVRLYSFPKDPIRRRLWELAVRRANWNATAGSVLCNFHFITGAPSTDKTHPDYVPTIFSHHKQPTIMGQKLSKYKRSAKKRRVENDSTIADNGAPSVYETDPDYVPTVFPHCQIYEGTDDMPEVSATKEQVENNSIITNKGRSLFKKGNSICCAVGCSMRRKTNLLSQVRLYHFPKDPIRRRFWELAVGRANWNATPGSVLCNFHFVTGAPSADKTHPDYVPSVFSHRQPSTNVGQKLCRYQRSAKPRRVKNDSTIEDNDFTLGAENSNPTHKSTEVQTVLTVDTTRMLQLKIKALELRNAFLEQKLKTVSKCKKCVK